MTDEEMVQGILRVEEYNQQFRDPNPRGSNPVCMNKLGTWNCERCGNDVRTYNGPCPAIPKSKRWGEDWNPNKEIAK